MEQSDLNGIAKQITDDLKAYYGFDMKVCYSAPTNREKVEVYIMNQAKYPGHDNDIKEQVIRVISSKLNYIEKENIDVRTNYAKFNPNFNPKVDNRIKDRTNGSETREQQEKSNEFDYEKLSLNYIAEEPRYSFNQVILPEKTMKQIENAIGILEVETKVFDEWGLRSIIPTASSALSFYGPPGTGKSMAAEAIAQKLGKRILRATYADIESKFHGEGPKMVKAIFRAAERDDAVLFLDESDSLLSKRLTNVSDGSAQAINSMRSQLLISLEQFKGIVIFATNLVVNYDKAFLSRLINVEFTMPTEKERENIWWRHLRTDSVHVPVSDDVDIAYIAKKYEFCGREIKSAVKSACISTALDKRDFVTQKDFLEACDSTKEETMRAVSAEDHTVTKVQLKDDQKEALMDAMQKKIDAEKVVKVDELPDS